jgi:hypothetical protein
VTVLADSQPRSVAPGVEVVGAPWTSKRPLRDLVTGVCGELTMEPGVRRILLAHGATDDLMTFDNPALISISCAEAALADGRLAFVGLGDRHSTTKVGSTGRIWYPGAPEPTDYDEQDPGNVLVVELAPDGSITVEPHRVGTWEFVYHSCSLDGPGAVEELETWLAERKDKDRTTVKLALEGTISLTEEARLQELLEHNRQLFAALEQHQRRTELTVRPDDDDFADLALSGFAQVALDALRTAASDEGREGQAARDALGLLVRFAGSREERA